VAGSSNERRASNGICLDIFERRTSLGKQYGGQAPVGTRRGAGRGKTPVRSANIEQYQDIGRHHRGVGLAKSKMATTVRRSSCLNKHLSQSAAYLAQPEIGRDFGKRRECAAWRRETKVSCSIPTACRQTLVLPALHTLLKDAKT
jgi:hypothetical protein